MNGIYIHIPFCIKKCLYCDFTSYTGCAHLHEKYINALGQEMSLYKGEKADTVFIGGGTPTILEPVLLNRLLSLVRDNFKLENNCEFTAEANPKTLDVEKLKILKDGGVNRLSIGVQSFFDNELKAIGRIHSAGEAERTISLARENGFDNINIDIMSSLPYQTKETLISSVKKAVSLGAEHISCYSLIIEDNTPIAEKYDSGIYKYPDENTDREMYYAVRDLLKKSDFERYEISNFAKKGRECRHNLKYWQGESYIGLGAAAHSFDGNTRRCNTDKLDEYLNGQFEKKTIKLTLNDKIEEYMITGLRTSYGINETVFLNKFGTEIKKVYKNVLDKFIKSGHMEYNNGVYKLTDSGIDISNTILCEFII